MFSEPSCSEKSMEVVPEDLSSLCRLCALKMDKMTSIFDPANPENDVNMQIRDCLPITIQENKIVSKLICTLCKENLKKFHDFRSNVLKANEIFASAENAQKPQMLNENLFKRIDEEIVDDDKHHTNKSIQKSCRICSACNQVLFDGKSSAKHDENCQKSVSNQINSGIREILLNSVFKCEFCDRCYVDEKSIRIHKASHVGEKSYVCLKCDIYYSTYEKLTEHKTEQCKSSETATAQDKTTIPKYFSCIHCDKTFMHFGSMNIHQKNCTVKAIDRYKCCHCGDRFMDSEGLAEHNSSEVNKKWQCQRCSMSFGSVCALLLHKKQPHGKQFSCAECGKEFLQKSHLTDHVKTHLSEKPFSCDLCDKAFKIKKERNNHRKTHMGVLPYKCALCEKSFSTSSRLRNHTKFHNDPKPFKCNVCDKAFKRFSAKKIHMTIHTGEKAFKCDVCDRAFKRKADMKKHKRTFHGVTCRTVALINV